MIPKKIRRTITVNGEPYEYCVTGCVSVYIKSLETGKEIKWWDDWKPKWKQSVKPENIKKIIEEYNEHSNFKRQCPVLPSHQ